MVNCRVSNSQVVEDMEVTRRTTKLVFSFPLLLSDLLLINFSVKGVILLNNNILMK